MFSFYQMADIKVETKGSLAALSTYTDNAKIHQSYRDVRA
jgi:hypothetical protein